MAAWYSFSDLIPISPFLTFLIAFSTARAPASVVTYGILSSTASLLMWYPSSADCLPDGVLIIKAISPLRIASLMFGDPG